MDYLALKRLEFFKGFMATSIVKFFISTVGIIGLYDLFISQVVPEEYQKLFPRLWQLGAPVTGSLTWQSWLSFGCIIFAILVFEYSFRAWRRSTPDNSQFYIESALVADGLNGLPPEFRARFRRNGKNGIFYIEYSWLANTWTQPRKIKVFECNRFSKGETVCFPIIYKLNDGCWRFGYSDSEQSGEGILRDLISHEREYRGRVVLLTEDDVSQSCYFILRSYQSGDLRPQVIGEHMFSHMFEWEGVSPPNHNYKSLFK